MARGAAKDTKKDTAKADKADGPKDDTKVIKTMSKAAQAKANTGLMKPLTPSPELAEVVGGDPLPRPEVVSRVWAYIKEHKLQNEANKQQIRADDKLEKIFGKKEATMFEMNKFLAKHLS